MRFDKIGEETVLTLGMNSLETLARACRYAVDFGLDDLAAEAAATALTLASCIALTAGDMDARERNHMQSVLECINGGETTHERQRQRQRGT